MKRREFSRKIKAQIINRAMNEAGQIVCEGCGLVLGKKPYQIDHTVPEGLRADDAAPLTADDGKLLGQACCHAPKTKNDVRQIRKADRQRDKHTGAAKSKNPMPGSRASRWKRKMNGEVVER